MLIGIGALTALALLFSLIGARNSRSWWIGTAVCSLVGGMMAGLLLNSEQSLGLVSGLGAEMTQQAGSAADVVAVTLMFAIGCFALCRMIAGFIRPLKTDGKYHNPIWKALLYGVCALLGAACVVYFLYTVAGAAIRGGGTAVKDLVILCAGTVYLLAGIGGVAQWNGRRKRIAREKMKEKQIAEEQRMKEQQAKEQAAQKQEQAAGASEQQTGQEAAEDCSSKKEEVAAAGISGIVNELFTRHK